MKVHNLNIQRESKSQLARLMANENLIVEHREVSTASFDVQHRILTLPIWKKMSNNVYDTLVGHEIGHALCTPSQPDDIIKAIEKIDAGNGNSAKTFLNVVEDARIERVVKVRYPGMRRRFASGYKEMFNDGFFCDVNQNLNKLSLIDRINLHFKIGSFMLISFSDKEKEFVDMVDNCKTFDDVVDVAKAIYDYSLYSLPKISLETDNKDPFDSVKLSDSNPGDSIAEDDIEEGSFDTGNDRVKNLVSKELNSLTGVPFSENEQVDQMSARTYHELEWNKKNLSLIRSFKQVKYINIPNLDGSKWVVPYAQVHADLSKVCSSPLVNGDTPRTPEERLKVLKHFKEQNMPVISFMVKEFEMKKAANQYSRRSVNKTGVLDTNKMFKHKYDEDIFRKIVKIPDAKNHGMVLLLDWSSSMETRSMICGAIEQVLNLILFCKAVQIPFEVFAFSDRYKDKSSFHDVEYDKGDIQIFRNMRLLNLLSSKMKTTELNHAMANILTFMGNFVSYYDKKYVHKNEDVGLFALGTTPLNSALICMGSILNAFRKQYNLEKTNFIVMTDGEDNKRIEVDGNVILHSDKVFIRDKKSRAEYYFDEFSLTGQNLTKVLLKNIQFNTESNVIGFYISNSSSASRCMREFSNLTENPSETKVKEFLKNKFVEFHDIGYNYFYILKGDSIRIENEMLKIDNPTSIASIAKSLKKFSRSKVINRPMLMKFMERISV